MTTSSLGLSASPAERIGDDPLTADTSSRIYSGAPFKAPQNELFISNDSSMKWHRIQKGKLF
jgi:hypothetical protein